MPIVLVTGAVTIYTGRLPKRYRAKALVASTTPSGNHEVMVRGTFANVRLRNQLAPGTEGGMTLHLPDGEQTEIFDAAERSNAAEGEGAPRSP